ncbi:ribonuclease H-like protein [Aspergillus egyptiacus]|nr:ribonuclease H-like protein [Aspergillus egyptiacus]
MVYIIHIYVDGGCRRNGQSDSIGAAAAVFRHRFGAYWRASTVDLPDSPPPTNQRAEITAIIIGLEKALEKIEELHSNPKIRVVIHSDSDYAIKCMTTWVYKWCRNGWTNSRGKPVANEDLIQRASNLDDDLRKLARVKYKWIPREENGRADWLANRAMDTQLE